MAARSSSRPQVNNEWRRFVQSYGKNLAYWYQPKGLAVTVDAVADRLSILAEFENKKTWRDCQAAYVRKLQRAGISEAESKWDDGGAPLARMLKQVLTVLGLAWIDVKDRVEITPAGHRFLSSGDKAGVLAMQALRYQFWNPGVSSKTHQAVRLHPVPFLVRLLQAIDGRLTTREYNLFVAKARAIDDVDDVAAQIDKFREADVDVQSEIVRLCQNYSIASIRRSSVYNTISLNRPYAYKMWCLSNLVEEGPSQELRLRQGSLRGSARGYLDAYNTDGTYIQFATEKEFLSWMGDPEQLPNSATALDVYVNRGDLFAAAEVKRTQGATTAEIRSFKKMMIDEKTLENNIEANFESFGKKLGLSLQLVGRQYATTVGPIDLLGWDRKSGVYVVFELKKGRSADRVFGQLSRYMGWVRKNLSEDGQVMGVIVGSSIDDKLRSARDAHDSTIHLMEYESKMSVSLV